MNGFEARVALVTGAGSESGIGFAAARILGERGARVAIAATTGRIHARAAELAELGIEAEGFAADLTDADAAAGLVAAVQDRFERLDILVNNAGMVQTGVEDVARRFIDTGPGEWDQMIAINLTTTVNVTRAAVPAMMAAGYGRIVNVSSSHGTGGQQPGVDGLQRR